MSLRLICIDTPMNRVRVYKRNPYGGMRLVDEATIIRPQCDTLPEQLESMRLNRPMAYVEMEPARA